ncbi:MAG: hypothetical protein ABI045_03280 [Flavobacteriales bacterium]
MVPETESKVYNLENRLQEYIYVFENYEEIISDHSYGSNTGWVVIFGRWVWLEDRKISKL